MTAYRATDPGETGMPATDSAVRHAPSTVPGSAAPPGHAARVATEVRYGVNSTVAEVVT